MPAPCAGALHTGVKYITANLSPGLTPPGVRGHSCQKLANDRERNKVKEAETSATAWKWTSFATRGKRFLEGGWVRSVWYMAFPDMVVVLPMMMPPSHQGDTEVNWQESLLKESLQCGIEVALACRWSFWQIGDLTGSERLAVFAKERNPASFWWYTHKTQWGFTKTNRQPLLWRLWVWTSNSSFKPFQSRVNAIFTPILF